MAMAGPRFFGFVIGGALPVALAANWLAGRLGSERGARRLDPRRAAPRSGSRCGWLIDAVRPAAGCGRRVRDRRHGGQLHRARRRSARGARARGLERRGARAVRCAARSRWSSAAKAHPTLLKSLGMLGLGRERVMRVPVDGQGRMRADAAAATARPSHRVPSGRQREHRRLRSARRTDRAARMTRGAWVHVDGAFGLWARGSASLRPLGRGLERADSWATDAHKWLNVPYDSGLAFVRDRARRCARRCRSRPRTCRQPRASAIRAISRPSSRAARAAWRCGRRCNRWVAAGIAELIERNCRQARRFAHGAARGRL